MLYSTLQDKKFNFPESIFTTPNGYIALSQIGTFVKEGSIGPGMGSAVSTNNILAFKKAFSEMIERRAIMVGGKEVRGLCKYMGPDSPPDIAVTCFPHYILSQPALHH